MVGLCCALGAMVILSLEGLTLFGAYFIVIGGIILVSAFLTAMYRVSVSYTHLDVYKRQVNILCSR